MIALKVQNLTKQYPSFTLDKVSFSAEEGQVIGLIGRNGAGKSTTIKAILGMICAQGDISVFGRAAAEQKEEIGYAGGGFRFYPQKTLKRIAQTVSSFYAGWNEARYRSLLQAFQLQEEKKITQLSEGMKVKFAIALALSHGARLLIMDEPTSGLDPLSREEICDLVLHLVQNEGVTVLFSTHITSDLTRIANRILYLSNGRLIADEELKTLLGKYSVALFARKEDAEQSGARGIKRVKEGFEGLMPRGGTCAGGILRDASIDEIIVHWETEAGK